jgi:pyrimidine deaminase RibD-like protein
MIAQEILTHQYNNTADLDGVLVRLCNLILQGQRRNADHYGLVAACVIDPKGRRVTGINHAVASGQRVDAERAAVASYNKQYGELPEGSLMITTLSPCTEHTGEMAQERVGISCSELMDELNIHRVYCGYLDPTQPHLQHDTFDCVETQNEKIQHVCKEIADCFLKKDINENTGLNYNGHTYMNTPRIQSLIQQAQEIESRLAPVESGHTRLWRGNRPGEVGQNPTFTNSLVCIALPFLQQYGGSLTYIDVPTGDLAQYTDRVASAPNSEFTVTPELAAQAQVVKENFADGRHPGRKGLAKRSGVNTKASVSSLRNTAKHSSGEKQRMAHWLANMKAGKARAKKK